MKRKPYIVIKYKKSSLLLEAERADGDFDRSMRISMTPINGRIPSGILARLRGDVHNKDSCRVYGQLEIHKCQGDFHITARGHGYQQFGGEHLDHDSILSIHGFLMGKKLISHILSMNSPSESTFPISSIHWILHFKLQMKVCSRCDAVLMVDLYKFQYFLSVVPTVYIAEDFERKIIETNQYAVTEQSHPSAGNMGHEVPGKPFL